MEDMRKVHLHLDVHFESVAEKLPAADAEANTWPAREGALQQGKPMVMSSPRPWLGKPAWERGSAAAAQPSEARRRLERSCSILNGLQSSFVGAAQSLTNFLRAPALMQNLALRPGVM